MRNIITLIGVILSIALIVIGKKRHNKLFVSIGVVLILICSVYIVPGFFRGVRDGFINGSM
ncbi:hypothetical protein [Clostridium gasigenes]|uniref:hypothetical protein n=1 Tax=Clostridium gasigenes TaxID=94869 RepID=UPI001C0C57DA|nr:hypothetical protein [Clostridium gasigenes]MBU3107728.1 hypothetical protein [Clostridium gasigenes]